MNFVNSLPPKRYLIPVLMVLCAAVIGGGLWRSIALATNVGKPQQEMSDKQRKALLRAELRDGLGREVRFTTRGDSAKDVSDSVESLASFIKGRSGVELDNEIKEKLSTLERETLAGKRSRISVDELSDALTETGLERASTLTDQEIEHAANALQNGGSNGSYVLLRASGKGYMKTPEFIANAQKLREQIPQGDPTVLLMARSAVAAEAKEKVQFYSEASPEQFGDALTNGLTPIQAAVVTYSVASDDLLLLSQRGLQRQVKREVRSLKALRISLPEVLKSDKAYGVNGRRFSTPLDLVMDKKTMGDLLDRIDRLTYKRRKA